MIELKLKRKEIDYLMRLFTNVDEPLYLKFKKALDKKPIPVASRKSRGRDFQEPDCEGEYI